MESLVLNLLLVLVIAWLAGQLATRIGYPSVLGELLAGIIVGPPLLGLLESNAALDVLAEVGVLLMMIYIGMEIDPRELVRASKGGFLAAIGGFVTPFVLCYLAIVMTGGSVMAAVFVGIAAGVTSLATKSRILVDLQLLDTRIAHVMMAGALIADTLSLILFAAVIGIGETNAFRASDLAIVAVKAVVFFAVATLIGLKGLPLLGQLMHRIKSFERTAYFMTVLIVGFLFAEMAELAGMHGILGAFLAGLFLREGVLGRSLSKELMGLVRDASIGFLAPIFFITAGFAVSLDVFSTELGLLVLVVGLATVGKIVGTALFYLPTGHGWREGITIGAGMNGRGAVEIIVAQIGLSAGLISQEIFSILVFMAIFTTATVPLFLKWGVTWLRNRGELVRSEEERSGVVIIGAGPVARSLAGLLARSQPVVLIDNNKEHCAFARSEGLEAIEGSALDEQVLSRARASQARYFLALTSNTEVNALSSQMARTVFYIPDVYICNQTPGEGHEVLLSHVKGSTLFGREIELDDWEYRIGHDRVGNELVRNEKLPVEESQRGTVFLDRLPETSKRLPVAVERNDMIVPFHSEIVLEEGDQVYLFEQVDALPVHQLDRFDYLVEACPVLDLEKEVTREAFFDMAASILAPRMGLDQADVKKRFLDRERVRPSVLLPGLAIPHIIVPGEGQFELLVARCREGIVFEEDPGGVHMLFVIAGTEDERTVHLRALSAIAQILQHEDFELEWMKAPDSEALRTLILRTSRKRLIRASLDGTSPLVTETNGSK